MKLIKLSVIVFSLLFFAQFAKAQSISVGASFGYHHPRVLIAANYPAYATYERPVYYGYSRRVYYSRPYYPRRYYARPVYYRVHRHNRCW
jgi:hypothetical protein